MRESNVRLVSEKIISLLTEYWAEAQEHLLSLVSQDVISKTETSKNASEGRQRSIKKSHEEFVAWGKTFFGRFQNKEVQKDSENAGFSVLSSLRWLGMNEQVVRRILTENKRELLDPFLGEIVAILALVLGWKNKDKEEFSQALGEIGVLGILTAKPIVLAIAVCGLALGYQKFRHTEALKKGGLIGLVGTTAAFAIPGAALGVLGSLVLVLYLNKKISVEKPVEDQVKDFFRDLSSGKAAANVKKAWGKVEGWLVDNLPDFGDPLKSPV